MLLLTSALTFNAIASEENELLTSNCSGIAQIGNAWATLNCVSGNCSGWIAPQYLSANGTCDESANFNATGYLSSVFISGYCNGGFISLYSSSEYVNLTGSCDNNGSFNGNMYISARFTSGPCQPNGTSTIYFSGNSASVTGSCNN